MKSLVLLVLSLHVTGAICAADGLVSKVPPAGQWVSFNVATRVGHKDGTTTDSKGILIVRSLANEKIDGRMCRWLEFEHSWEQLAGAKIQRRFHSSVTKVAVVESSLAMGFDPAKDIVRGFHAKTSADHKPDAWTYNRVTKVKKGVGSYTGLGAVDFYLRPTLKHSKTLKDRTIVVNEAKLECNGFKTIETVDRPGEKQDLTITLSQWKNPKVPFGVVEYQIGRKRSNGSTFNQKLTMKDSGKNAKPSITQTE